MSEHRPAIYEVFTPRRPEVNRLIYVDRDNLEKDLARALRGSLHPILFGESGSGKSWLYKKVLEDIHAEVFTANSANATPLRLGSLTAEFQSIVASENPQVLREIEQELNAGLNIPIAEAGIKGKRKYELLETDPVLACFELLRNRAGNRPAVLVIDNLEMIFSNSERMEELASIITLLDDRRYAQYDVKILIVGVPGEIRSYLSGVNASVANRVTELTEVASLSEGQVQELVARGFVDLLKVEFYDGLLRTWQDHVLYVTMGFAQAIAEYCEQLAYAVQDENWSASEALLAKADEAWFKQGLNKASITVAACMNERETKAGRRNQVLYPLGKLNNRIFTTADIELILRAEFPDSTAEITLAVGQILAELSQGEDPIIRRTPKSTSYEFRDARYAMALRVLLQKDSQREKVLKTHELAAVASPTNLFGHKHS